MVERLARCSTSALLSLGEDRSSANVRDVVRQRKGKDQGKQKDGGKDKDRGMQKRKEQDGGTHKRKDKGRGKH